jgi:hypothetical protein
MITLAQLPPDTPGISMEQYLARERQRNFELGRELRANRAPNEAIERLKREEEYQARVAARREGKR